MKRPEINAEIITPAITEAVNENYAPECENVEDIVSAYLDGYTDGYELAKELDDRYSWTVDSELAVWLDSISLVADKAYHQYLETWAAENSVELQYKPGDEIECSGHKAIIKDVYKYRPLSYSIQFVDTNPQYNSAVGSNSSLIVWFDDERIKKLEDQEEKKPVPTFNDLIDAAVQAHKDKVLSNVELRENEIFLSGLGVVRDYVNSDVISSAINDIKSLYTEAFVIESESDMKALFSKNESIEITALNKSVFTYDDLGDLLAIDDKNLFKLLKGATVTQKRGAA